MGSVIVQQVNRPVIISDVGRQGASGVIPPSTVLTLDPVQFAYGDASPRVAVTLPFACEIVSVLFQIDQTFDGVGAALSLGTAGNPELLMPINGNYPSEIGQYESSPAAELTISTDIIITITPGAGATQGSGEIIFNVST